MAIPTADSDVTADSGVLTADVGPHSILHIWVMTDLVAPSVPTALAATPVSETQINLAWQASSDQQTGVAAYRVYADGVQVAQLNALAFQHTGLAAYSSHGYAVSAVDAAGNESARSAVVNARSLDTTAPSVPAGLVASPISENEIDLSWSAASDTGSGLSGYKVYRDSSPLGQVASLTYRDTGCAAYSQHSYRVSALDASGNESAQCTAVSARSLDTTAPSVPTGLTATPVSSSEIDLAWNPSTDAGSGVNQYRVYRDGALIATTALRSLADTGRTSATQYSYTVAATDNAGNVSAQCSAVSATTQTTGGGTFDYFMAPAGLDTNDGLSPTDTGGGHGPWSLNAFNNSTARSKYAGKGVGLVGDQGPFQYTNDGITGQQSLYSQNAVPGAGPTTLLSIQGGSTAMTYVASCTSAGVYSPRLAVIDCRDPTTGAYPSGAGGGGLIGQSDGVNSKQPTLWGNVTIDGITLRGFAYAGIVFRNLSGRLVNPIVIKNCELYDNIGGPNTSNGLSSAGNPAAIHLTSTGTTSGDCTVINNKVHDVYTDSSSYQGYGCDAIELITWQGKWQISNNTCYNCGGGISLKDSTLGWGSIDHNYCESGQFGYQSSYGQGYFSAIMFPQPGYQRPPININNNIVIGIINARSAGSGTANEGSGTIENNTIYMPNVSSISTGPLQCGVWQSSYHPRPPGTWTWKGNIVYWEGGNYSTGSRGAVAFDFNAMGTTGLDSTTADYNWYGSNGTGCTFAVGYPSNMSYAVYRAATGYDSHSTYSGSPFAATPVALDPSSFALNPALSPSPLTAGPGGGPVGATGTIGCDFALISVGTVPAATVGQAYAGVTLTANGVGPFSWQLISAAPNWLRVWGTEGAALGSGQTMTFGQGAIPQNVETDTITVACTDANSTVRQVTFNITAGHQ